MAHPPDACSTSCIPVARPRRRERAWLAALLVMLATLALYSRLWWTDSAFLILGDYEQILGSNLIAHPAWYKANRLIIDIVQVPASAMRQPLARLSWMLDGWVCRQFKLPDWSGVFHAHSALLHCGNVVLVFALMRRFAFSVIAAALVALVFGVHPAQAEAAAWVSQRGVLLGTFFGLCSTLTYLNAADPTRRRLAWWIPCIVLYVLSLLAWPGMLLLPVVFMALDVAPLNRFSARAVMEKLPILIPTVAACVLLIVGESTNPTESPPSFVGPVNACANFVRGVASVIGQVMPALSYPQRPARSVLTSDPIEYLPIGIVLLCLVYVIFSSRRRPPAIAVSGACIGLLLFPAVAWFTQPGQSPTGSTTYLALLPLLVVGAAGIRLPFTPGPQWNKTVQRCLTALVPIGVATTALGGYMQILVWHDNHSLLTFALSEQPDHVPYQLALAEWHSLNDRPQEAAVLLRRTIEQQPHNAEANYRLGNALGAQGRMDEASQHYGIATQVMPDKADYWRAQGGALFVLHRYVESAAAFEHAARLDADSAIIRAGLGQCYLKLQRPAAAREQFTLALRKRPSDPMTHFGMATAWAAMDVPDSAAAHLLAAIEKDASYSSRAWSEPALRRWADLPEFAGLVVNPEVSP